MTDFDTLTRHQWSAARQYQQTSGSIFICVIWAKQRKTEKMLNVHVVSRMENAWKWMCRAAVVGVRKIFVQFYLFNKIEVWTSDNCTLNTFRKPNNSRHSSMFFLCPLVWGHWTNFPDLFALHLKVNWLLVFESHLIVGRPVQQSSIVRRFYMANVSGLQSHCFIFVSANAIDANECIYVMWSDETDTATCERRHGQQRRWTNIAVNVPVSARVA